MSARQVKIIAGGKLMIPASMRRELAIAPGDTVLVDIDQAELRVRSLARAVERAQAIVRSRTPADRSLADELIAERRGEAALD